MSPLSKPLVLQPHRFGQIEGAGQLTDLCKDSSGRMQLIDKSAILDIFPGFEVKVDMPNLAG
jgi:hypothetical protein